jgi:hypothetical protein
MKIYRFSPEDTIPELGTVQRQILDLISDVEPIERKELVRIDDNFRRVIQELEGDRFGYWSIDRIHEGGSKKATHYQINRRHFSSIESDFLARAERRLELRKDSLEQAISESARVKPAFEELREAEQVLFDLNKGNAQQKPSV